MCSVLNVSRSGYYAWKKRKPSKRAQYNAMLLEQIKCAYKKNRSVYGSPRIHVVLQAQGFNCGIHRIARLMRENHIQAQQYKRIQNKVKYVSTAKVDNILNRRFAVDKPNTVWASDITCIWTGSGWLSLAIVMDLYARKIVGWSMQNRMTEKLTIEALQMALTQRKPAKNLLHHSDQGSQYQSRAFQDVLERHRITPSMSRKGQCHDNAVAESFFKTLKTEIGMDRRFKTREQARFVLFEYIEIFYNKTRLHSTLGYMSPKQYEEKKLTN